MTPWAPPAGLNSQRAHPCPHTPATPLPTSLAASLSSAVSTSRRSSRQSLCNARPIKREEKPAGLVRTTLYLLSNLSGFACGQSIVVDGGHIMY